MTKKPSLAETHPELAAQADGWDPRTVAPFSGKKLNWRCEKGHVWSATVANRTANKSGCAVCSNYKVLAGFNDLATTHPQVAAQAEGWDPSKITYGNNQKLKWKCGKGHVWLADPGSRTRGRGCPYCSGNKVLAGFNDLATTHPKLASQVMGWDPTTLSAGSNKKLKWKCEQEHIYKATIANRSLNNSGCPFCSSNSVLAGFNDLATTYPKIAAQADGWDPKTVAPFSGRREKWRCGVGHSYKAAISMRTSRDSGCPFCSHKKVLKGFNDLATTHPQVAAQAEGWDPSKIIAGSNKKLNWKCEEGHLYSSTPHMRSSDRSCPFCSGNKVLVGFNDLATTHPELALQAVGWDPSKITGGNNKKVKWKCEEGHTWLTAAHTRTSGRGCPSCAKSGFDPNQPGFLYLIDHFDLQMFQIGITNFPEDRLGDHTRRGWEVIELRGPMDGHLTQQLETSSLRALEKRGAILGHKAGIDKFDGYSEAWTKASLNVTSIKQILDWVYEDEGVKNV